MGSPVLFSDYVYFYVPNREVFTHCERILFGFGAGYSNGSRNLQTHYDPCETVSGETPIALFVSPSGMMSLAFECDREWLEENNNQSDRHLVDVGYILALG